MVITENTTKLTYQWQKDGLHITEMEGKFEGVNTANLTIKNARNIDEGSYRCVISNGSGGNNLTSNKAFLDVCKLPFP